MELMGVTNDQLEAYIDLCQIIGRNYSVYNTENTKNLKHMRKKEDVQKVAAIFHAGFPLLRCIALVKIAILHKSVICDSFLLKVLLLPTLWNWYPTFRCLFRPATPFFRTACLLNMEELLVDEERQLLVILFVLYVYSFQRSIFLMVRRQSLE